ncbi:MAG TPA: heparinase II/III family protein [archaeon]|nr:heparinase II/III family protein [archaeon]
MLKRLVFTVIFLSLGLADLSQAVEVFNGHPRLFFRDKAWGEPSITTEILRQRARDSRYSKFLDLMTRRNPCNYALRAVMLDDKEAALQCISMLEKPLEFDGTTDDGRILMWDAMAFDWLYNNQNFSDSSKAKVIARLAQGAQRCMDQYYSQGAHIFHTRMYGYPTGAAIAGLALKGHHPDADKYLEWGYKTYLKDLFPAREIQDGTVHNSMAYGRKYTMWLVGHFIAAWYTATGENLWRMIREKQGDWAWREALFVIYGEQPDGLLVRFGDNFFRGTERFSFRVVSERAFYYNEPVGAGYINYLFEKHAGITNGRIGTEMGSEYQVFLYWDADNKGVPRTTLPARILFSPRGTGMAFWRTGWGADDTFIFFKCGDYFDNHGHFDSGHTEVFRRAPLLIEAGTYAGGTDTDHYKKFFHNSVAHNTIQIVDPGLLDDAGSQRYYNNQTIGTIEAYRANKEREMGDIIQYRDEGGWAYLAADFTAAYTPDRVRKVVRELAWIGERYLVVVDNISLADKKFQPRILWHYPVRPLLEKKRFTVSDAGARAIVTVLAPEMAVIDTVPAFKVGTAFYPPEKPRPDLGVGRAEIYVPTTGNYDYTFVQVIDVADNTAAAPSPRLEVKEISGATIIKLPEGTLTLAGQADKRTGVDFK